MKKIIVILSILIGFSCTHVKQIGKLNMISTRNVDVKSRYKLISSYSGGSNKELKNSRSKSLDEAVDETVKRVPSGEFIMNAKIYLIQHGRKKFYYAIEGDVWGHDESVASYRGFKVGDKVSWKNKKNVVEKIKSAKKEFLTGVISGLKDNSKCLVKLDNSTETIELEYDNITKTN